MGEGGGHVEMNDVSKDDRRGREAQASNKRAEKGSVRESRMRDSLNKQKMTGKIKINPNGDHRTRGDAHFE